MTCHYRVACPLPIVLTLPVGPWLPGRLWPQELGIYGRLRKISRCGPVSMFRQALGRAALRMKCTCSLGLCGDAAALAAGDLGSWLPGLACVQGAARSVARPLLACRGG